MPNQDGIGRTERDATATVTAFLRIAGDCRKGAKEWAVQPQRERADTGVDSQIALGSCCQMCSLWEKQ